MSTYRRFVILGSTAALLGSMTVGLVAMRDARPATGRHLVEAASTTTAKQKWIVVGSDAQAQQAAMAKAQAAKRTTMAPPRQVPNGPAAAALTKYLRSVVPTGSTPSTSVDYPDLHAASLTYTTPDGNLITLAGQRLSRKVTLESITLDPSPAGLSDLASGSQLVEIRSAMPTPADTAQTPAAAGLRDLQVVVVRPSGISLTLTVTSATPGAAVNFTATANPDHLRAAAVKAFDAPAADKLF